MPLGPDELIRVRQIMRVAERVPVLDSYVDASDVAGLLKLDNRTVRDLAHRGAFDGTWGKAFKPSPNRLRIPKQGVEAYISARAVFLGSADAGTRRVMA